MKDKKSLTTPQKISLLLAVSFIIALPLALFASQNQTRTAPKASGGPTPTSPFTTPDTSTQKIEIQTIQETTKRDIDTIKAKLLPQNKVAFVVGSEKIYHKDLEYILTREFPQDYATESANLDRLVRLSFPLAQEESLILQSAKNTLIPLTPEIFNNFDKDHDLRRSKVAQLREFLHRGEEKISGEMITVWYHNVTLPPMVTAEGKTLAEAQNFALEKIYNSYKEIKAGKEFKLVGQSLEQDVTLARIDPSYRANAYLEFTDKSKSDALFVRPELNAAAWGLQPGQTTSIIQVPPQQISLGKYDEEFFAIIKVNRRVNSGVGDYDELVTIEKQNRITMNCQTENCAL